VLGLSALWLWNDREISLRDNARLRAEIDKLGSDNSLADLRIASLEGQLEQYKGTRAVVVWNQSKHEGQIQLTNLPATGEGKDYQLWIVDPAHKNPISAGLIQRNADGTANVRFQPVQLIREASAFAITLEKTGGVEVAEGPVVVVGK
jgi:anti-sigma-K factor RskA